MHHPTDRIIHTTAFVTPVVEHWLEREIAQWVHSMKDRTDDPSHHERTLLPRSYISLLSLRSRLPIFISNVLKDRSFKVRVGSTFSDHHPQEMGVPQGSILPVTLLSVKINSIALLIARYEWCCHHPLCSLYCMPE